MFSKNYYVDAVAASLTYLLAAAFLLHLMLSTPLLPGIDGPYYAVQVRWLVERGALKYADPPLAFLLLAAFYLALGDLFLAVKLGSALMTALSAVPVYLLVRRLTSSRVAGATAGLALVVNPFTLKLYSDFIKNSIGLLWLNLFLLFDVEYVRSPSRRSLACLAAALLLTALTHVLDYGVALYYALLIFLIYALLTHDVGRGLPGAAAALLSLAGLVAAPWVVGGDVSKGFAFIAQLAEEEIEPVVMQQHWLALALAVSAALLVRGCYLRGRPEAASLYIASSALAVLLNLPILPRSWLFRFRLMTSVPLAYAAGLVLASEREGERLAAAALILALLLIVTLPATRVMRPSIPPLAYQELKEAVARCEALAGEASVPDVRLRYWAETISDSVEGATRGSPPAGCLILLKSGGPIHAPPGQGIYEGEYVLALRPGKPGSP